MFPINCYGWRSSADACPSFMIPDAIRILHRIMESLSTPLPWATWDLSAVVDGHPYTPVERRFGESGKKLRLHLQRLQSVSAASKCSVLIYDWCVIEKEQKTNHQYPSLLVFDHDSPQSSILLFCSPCFFRNNLHLICTCLIQ